MAREIVKQGLNVRQVEALGQEQAAAKGKTIGTRARRARARTPTRWRWRSGCPMRSGLVVSIDHRGKGGVLHVRYRTLEQLDEVIRRLEVRSGGRSRCSRAFGGL